MFDALNRSFNEYAFIYESSKKGLSEKHSTCDNISVFRSEVVCKQ